MRKKRAGVVAAIAVGLALAHAVAGNAPACGQRDEKHNLIVNGSFEDGLEVEQSFLPVDEDSVEIRGWVVTRGQIDLLQESGGKRKAAHGNRALDLHG